MNQVSIQNEIDGLKETLTLEQQYLLAGRARGGSPIPGPDSQTRNALAEFIR